MKDPRCASRRSSLLVCVSCWGSQRPRGAAASPTLRGTPRPCSWRGRAAPASAQTDSPTSSFCLKSMCEIPAWLMDGEDVSQSLPVSSSQGPSQEVTNLDINTRKRAVLWSVSNKWHFHETILKKRPETLPLKDQNPIDQLNVLYKD